MRRLGIFTYSGTGRGGFFIWTCGSDRPKESKMIVKNSVIEILAMFFPRLVIWVMENIREWDPIIWLWLCSISYRKNIATFSMTWSHTLTFSKTSDFHFCSGKIIVKISTIQFWTKFFNIIFDTLRRPDQHVKRKNPFFWGGASLWMKKSDQN